MIPAGVQMFVALEPVDMRYGFERLAGLVRERIGYEARSGALFLFVGKRRETVKILFWDGRGMCLFYKSWIAVCSCCPMPWPRAPPTSRWRM